MYKYWLDGQKSSDKRSREFYVPFCQQHRCTFLNTRCFIHLDTQSVQRGDAVRVERHRWILSVGSFQLHSGVNQTTQDIQSGPCAVTDWVPDIFQPRWLTQHLTQQTSTHTSTQRHSRSTKLTLSSTVILCYCDSWQHNNQMYSARCCDTFNVYNCSR